MKKLISFITVFAILFSLFGTYSATAQEQEILTLLYDDRYTFDGYEVISVESTNITSYKAGYEIDEKTIKDDTVITVSDDKSTVIASGVGSAKLTLSNGNTTVQKYVTVSPAPLSIFFMAGQSNGEGIDGSMSQSLANKDGTVYSTFAPSIPWAGQVLTGNKEYKENLTVDNAASHVASSLTSNISNAGTELLYPLNGICDSGNGKSGMDAAIAYSWYKNTGEKCWIVNACHNGTSIEVWNPNDETESNEFYQSVAVFKEAMKTLEAEISAGHYEYRHSAYIWMQGESDHNKTYEYYRESYIKMHKAYKSELIWDIDGDGTEQSILEFGGIIPTRVCNTTPMFTYNDIKINGPRLAQYTMCAESDGDCADIYMLCNIGDFWVDSDSGSSSKFLKQWFKKWYPNGVIDYPTQDGESPAIPAKSAEIHNYAHFSQVGYNEIGLEVGRALAFDFGYATASELGYDEIEIRYLDINGYLHYEDEFGIEKGSSKAVIPYVYPAFASSLGLKVDYDQNTCEISDGYITAYETGTIKYSLNDDISDEIHLNAFNYGDANNDGKINGKDVLVMRKYIVGLDVEINLYAADVLMVEKINVNGKDVLQLRKYLIGLEKEIGIYM
ncbi:MAG: sialate O-acetylesterase [Acutalibacteraceae bacterium]|nr:sialate O-acetylesterase [Acutalibacteraceae bacterium]